MSAAIPSAAVNKTGRSDSGATEVRGTMSHGRGGAGNMGTTPTDFDRPSLDTPTIKSEVYTTGRGGKGNMAKNDDPEAARRAQDVVAAPRRESNNSSHVGRGGAANVFSPSQLAELKKNGANHDSAIDAVSQDGEKVQETAKLRKGEKGWADRSKDWLFKRVRELKYGKNAGQSVASKDVSGGGLIREGNKHIEGSGSGIMVEEGMVEKDTREDGEGITFEGTSNTVLGVGDHLYPRARRLPHSRNMGSYNDNRVSGGVFDNNPSFDISNAAGLSVTPVHTSMPQSPTARKGLYATRFKSSWNLRERFSSANLRAKAKEGEEDEREDGEEGVEKKDKLGMRKAFGKSTFF